MAQEIVGFKLVLDGKEQVVGSIGEMKKLLKDANFELVKAQQNFGEYSAEAVSAAKKVAQLKDTIQEAKETSDLFDPGKKFQAFAGAISAVAGGFSAVQGALGLVGVESENVEKTLLKVQSALALSQGLSTIADAAKDFKRLNAIIQQTAIFQKANNAATTVAIALQKAFGVATIGTGRAFTILKGAIAATGIGLLVVGVSALVNKIMDWTSSTEDNEKAQNSLNDTIEYQNRLLDENLKSISNANRLQVLRAKESGKSVKEIYDIEVQGLRDQAKALRESYNARLQYEETPEFKKLKLEDQRKYYDESNKINQQYVDKNNELAVKEQEFRTQSAETQRQENKKNLDENKNRLKQQQQDQKEALDKLKALQDENFANSIKDETQRALVKLSQQKEKDIIEIQQTKATAETKARLIAEIENQFRLQKEQIETDAALKKKEKEDADIKESADKTVKSLEERNQRIREQYEYDKNLREEFQQAELEATKYLQDQKNALLDAGINFALALAGRNEKLANAIFAIQKAVEIGRIITTTTASIAKIKADTFSIPAFVGPGLPNPLFVKALTAMGAKIAGLKIGAATSIASIAASTISKFKSGSGGSNIGGAQDAGSVGGGAAPIAPQLPQAQLTQLDQQTINRLGSATSRAYVVETDITNSQERIRRINRAARLG